MKLQFNFIESVFKQDIHQNILAEAEDVFAKIMNNLENIEKKELIKNN